MFQTKEQDKTPEEELSDVEIGSRPQKEFRVVIIKMIKELGKRMDAQSKKLEVFNKELKNIKNNQTKLKNTITEMKNTLEGINSRLNEAEEQIGELKTEQWKSLPLNRKRMKRNEDSLRDLWDNIKHANIRVIGIPEG